MLFWLHHIPGHHILLYSHSEVRLLTFAGYNRGLNKYKIVLKHEFQATALCCPCFTAYFGSNFVRPGNNVISHSVVDTSLRIEHGTDPLLAQPAKQILTSHYLQGCTTPKREGTILL